MAGVSPEMGKKKLNKDRELKIFSVLGGNNSSRISDGHIIGFVHSYQIYMEALKMPDISPSDIFSSKQEKPFFNQPFY